jgi:hypothetical protein
LHHTGFVFPSYIYIENILVDSNLLASYFFVFFFFKFHLNSKIYNVSSQKFHVLSCYDEHGTMALYDDNVLLTKNTIITNNSVEFIIAFFSDNTWKALYIIAVYKPPEMQVSHFNYILKKIIQKLPSHCLTIIIGDFNVNFLPKTNQLSTLQAFMNKYIFKLIFIESTIINDTQINHIWTNAQIQQCRFRTTQAC